MSESTQPSSTGRGVGFAFAAYALWGGMPIYFLLLLPSGPIEIVAWRILLSVAVCVIFISVTRGWRRFATIVRDRRTTLTLGVGGLFVCANWTVYVLASVTGHVIEAALGYFINPIFTALLGVVLLRERLRPLQWVAVGVSAVAVVIIAINYGQFPWISVLLALSFGLYGFVKKRVGGTVDALSGLAIETAWLAPVAVVTLIIIAATGGLTMGTGTTAHTILLLGAGFVTAIPLLLFAAAARRLPLTYIGLTQYLTPILQFLVGVLVLHEAMPPARWVGFALVWAALIVLTVDMLAAGRSAGRLRLQGA